MFCLDNQTCLCYLDDARQYPNDQISVESCFHQHQTESDLIDQKNILINIRFDHHHHHHQYTIYCISYKKKPKNTHAHTLGTKNIVKKDEKKRQSRRRRRMNGHRIDYSRTVYGSISRAHDNTYCTTTTTTKESSRLD